MSEIIQVQLKRIIKLCNPFREYIFSISKEDVQKAIKHKRFVLPTGREGYGVDSDHAGRIAYLTTCPEIWDPISLDVGIPSLDYYPDWLIEDGNHRTCAAIIIGLKTLSCYIAGEVETAEKLLGIKIK